jgi:organic radical activating enzyme
MRRGREGKPMPPQVAGPTAALAGVPAGLQAQGVWSGRRQIFVRFAAEAETATMYTAEALANELRRTALRSSYHSISISGRDPLSNVDYLCAAFAKPPVDLPVMLDTDGQRPEAIGALKKVVGLTQVSLDGSTLEASSERALRTLHAAAEAGMQHALVLSSSEQTSDAQLLRIVEQARGVSGATQIVIHPPPGVPVDRDRRWMTLLERAAALHGDVRFALKLPPPTGMR